MARTRGEVFIIKEWDEIIGIFTDEKHARELVDYMPDATITAYPTNQLGAGGPHTYRAVVSPAGELMTIELRPDLQVTNAMARDVVTALRLDNNAITMIPVTQLMPEQRVLQVVGFGNTAKRAERSAHANLQLVTEVMRSHGEDLRAGR